MSDLGQVLTRKLLEHHDVIDTVEQLGAEQAFELAHRTAADLARGKALLAGGAEANARILRNLAAPTLDVMMITVLRKSTVLPWLSVRRPSSSTCSRMLKISGCAFSISSNSTTEYG